MYILNSGIWTPYKTKDVENMLGRAVVFLDNWEFKRLANIRQTSFVYMVNPASNNTRLEHSIGAGYLAGEIGKSVGLKEDEIAHLRLAALCHDLGHPFWSHIGENLIRELTGKDHETITLEKLERLRDAIEQQQFDYRMIRGMLDGSHPYHQMVSNYLISADKLDYLLRDKYHISGGPDFDLQHLMMFLRFRDGKYGLDQHALGSLEGAAMAYFHAYITNYLTQNAMLIGEGMSKALYNAIKGLHITPDQMTEWDDTEPMNIIRYSNDCTARRMYETFFGRRNVRPSMMITATQINHIDPKTPHSDLEGQRVDDDEYMQLAEYIGTVSIRDRKSAQIAEIAGVPSADVVLFMISGEKINIDDITVFCPDREKKLSEVSNIVSAIEKMKTYHDVICLAVNGDSVYRVSALVKEKGFAKLLHELE